MQGLVLVLCAMLIGGIADESAASDAAAAPENQPVATADTAQRVRTAAFVIAAADSPEHLKSQADFVCPGTNDHAVINAAIAALQAGDAAGARRAARAGCANCIGASANALTLHPSSMKRSIAARRINNWRPSS